MWLIFWIEYLQINIYVNTIENSFNNKIVLLTKYCFQMER